MAKTDRTSPPLQKFLSRLADPARPSIAAYNVAVVLAHPSDAVGCGAILQRLRGAQIVAVGDGVKTHSSQGESAARWHEFLAALELTWHRPSTITALAVPEGEVEEQSAGITQRVARLFASCGTAIALAYAREGRGADRDATAFAVQRAAELCRTRGQDVATVQMTSSPSSGREAVRLALTAGERDLKQRMLGCFAEGVELPTIEPFEEFLPAPLPDVEEGPDWGKVLHNA